MPLTSFDKSGVPYLKSDMPRVLLPGEPYTTSVEEKQEAMNAFRQTMESIMVKHHTAFLTMFKQMMVGVFGPAMERTEKLVLLLIVNQLEMQVLSRLCKVPEVNQSSRLYKVLGVVQSSNRTLIRQCPIGLIMEI
jgi:hypothetical protein